MTVPRMARRMLWVVERRPKGRKAWTPMLDCVRPRHRWALRDRDRLRQHWPDEEFRVRLYTPEIDG